MENANIDFMPQLQNFNCFYKTFDAVSAASYKRVDGKKYRTLDYTNPPILQYAVNGMNLFCNRCDLSSKESYIAWTKEWKRHYNGLTKLIRDFKKYKKLVYARDTFEYLNIKDEDIHTFHQKRVNSLQLDLYSLRALAYTMLNTRANMKLASKIKREENIKNRLTEAA